MLLSKKNILSRDIRKVFEESEMDEFYFRRKILFFRLIEIIQPLSWFTLAMQTPDTFHLNFCFKLDPLWFSEETTTSIRTPPRNQGFYLTRSTRDQTANQLRKLIRHARERERARTVPITGDASIYIYRHTSAAVSRRNCSKPNDERRGQKKVDKASMWRTRERIGARAEEQTDGEEGEGIESDRKKTENRQTKWRVLARRSAKAVQRRGGRARGRKELEDFFLFKP